MYSVTSEEPASSLMLLECFLLHLFSFIYFIWSKIKYVINISVFKGFSIDFFLIVNHISVFKSTVYFGMGELAQQIKTGSQFLAPTNMEEVNDSSKPL